MSFATTRTRLASELRILRCIILGEAGLGSMFLLGAGVLYLFVPYDLIPDRLPLIGHLDEATAILGGGLAARLWVSPDVLVPRNRAEANKPQVAIRNMGWPFAIVIVLRRATLTVTARLIARPVLRLTIGRWPESNEIEVFRRCLVRADTAPPLLRALAGVPAARTELTRAMVTSWLTAEESDRDRLRQELGSCSPMQGDRLRVWLGPPVSFLHLEKTGGMSLVTILTQLFHPLQIDPDPLRRFPPHVVSPFPPFIAEKVRRYPLVWGHYDLPSLRRLGVDRFTITMLREPRARIISLFVYWRRNSVRQAGTSGYNRAVLIAQTSTFLEFLRSEDLEVRGYIDSFYVRRLTGLYETGLGPDPISLAPDRALAQALAALDGIEFVGTTERMDEGLAVLGCLLGFEPPAAAPRVNAARRSGLRLRQSIGLCDRPLDEEVESELERLTRLDRIVYAAAQARFARLSAACASQ